MILVFIYNLQNRPFHKKSAQELQKLPKIEPEWTKNGRKITEFSTKNENRKLNEKLIKKTSQKAPKCVREEGNHYALFAYFSSLGHPWEPEWAQDPSQEPPGPLRTSILGEF